MIGAVVSGLCAVRELSKRENLWRVVECCNDAEQLYHSGAITEEQLAKVLLSLWEYVKAGDNKDGGIPIIHGATFVERRGMRYYVIVNVGQGPKELLIGLGFVQEGGEGKTFVKRLHDFGAAIDECNRLSRLGIEVIPYLAAGTDH